MSNEMFTQLPTTTAATLSDIICAVQGNTSVQETLGQISSLVTNNVVLNYPGNPNGNLAGTTFQLCWDTTDKILYVCTTSGTSGTAIWTPITASSFIITWNNVTGTSAIMSPNNGYVSNNAGLVTLTLPVNAAFGTQISIIGLGAGGWSIAQNAGQSIQIGNVTSTVGVTGSVSSTLPSDSLNLICVSANTKWAISGGAQGNLTIV